MALWVWLLLGSSLLGGCSLIMHAGVSGQYEKLESNKIGIDDEVGGTAHIGLWVKPYKFPLAFGLSGLEHGAADVQGTSHFSRKYRDNNMSSTDFLWMADGEERRYFVRFSQIKAEFGGLANEASPIPIDGWQLSLGVMWRKFEEASYDPWGWLFLESGHVGRRWHGLMVEAFVGNDRILGTKFGSDYAEDGVEHRVSRFSAGIRLSYFLQTTPWLTAAYFKNKRDTD